LDPLCSGDISVYSESKEKIHPISEKKVKKGKRINGKADKRKNDEKALRLKELKREQRKKTKEKIS
jgi:hypothetical protein